MVADSGVPRAGDLSRASVDRLLELARVHLQMDVAFISQFTQLQDRKQFRHVVHGGKDNHPLLGFVEPLTDSYCQMIVDGRLDAITPDAAAHPVLRAMPVTRALDIRAYIGVAIVLSNGETYGTLCCFRNLPDPTLGPRDAATLRMLASIVAERVEEIDFVERERRQATQRTIGALEGDQHTMVFQPIVDLTTGRAAGIEALSRFRDEPVRPPEWWFALASTAGLGVELETKALRAALAVLPALPADVYLAVNLSADALCHELVQQELDLVMLDQIVVEITEHALSQNRELLAQRLEAGRGRHLRMALDDFGSGYASLERVLEVAPEILKLDRALVQGVAMDPARRAMVDATNRLGQAVGSQVVAEGIETEEDLRQLRALNVPYGQGYLFAHPHPDPVAAATWCWA